MLAILQTDRSIIRNVLRGRTDRFGVLVDRYGRLVYAIAYAYLRNPQDAEDVVQESYTRLYQRLDTFSWKQSIGPWLAQVARNVAVDRLRKRGHEVLVADPPAASITHLPNPARDEMRQLVAEQLGHLDTADREVLLLHYFLGKKAREIAALLEIQPDAAAKRLQRARDELGRRLVDVLKQDLLEDRAEPARRRRIMASIAATAIPWKPSAAAAAAVSVIAGASATKSLLIVAATMAVVFAGLFVGLRLWFPRLHFLPRTIQTTSQYIENVQPALPDATTATANDAAKAKAEPAPAPEPDAAAPNHGPGRAVSGIVVTAQVQPVPGAKVTVDNSINVKTREWLRKTGIGLAPLSPFELSTVSGEDGTFSFACVPFMIGNPQIEVTISAEAGELSGMRTFYCAPDLTDEFIEITVHPSTTLAGIVTDIAGVPVEHARIVLKDIPRETDAGEPWGLSPCWTGPDGRFVIKHVMRGEFRFTVNAKGYASFPTDWFPAGKTDIVIRLERGNSISGRVVEKGSGVPVTEGWVWARSDTEGTQTRIDAEGQFMLAGLKPGKTTMTFMSPQVYSVLGTGGQGAELEPKSRDIPACPYILPEPVVVTVVEGRAVTDFRLEVVRGAVLSGQVTDAASGVPLPDASVIVMGKSSMPRVPPDKPFPYQAVNTDADGHYEAPGLPPGDLELVAQAKDYAEKTTKVVVGNYGQAQRVDVRMELMPAVSGTVVDSAGAPVAGASIVAVYATDNTEPWPDPAVSDAAGDFRLNLPKNKPVRLQACHQSGISPVTEAVAPGTTDVVLCLADGGSIEGTVVDAAGTFVNEARVTITPVEGEAQETLRFTTERGPRTPRKGPGTSCWTRGGFFRTGVFPAGYYDLKVYTSLSQWAVGSTRVLVRAGQTLQTRLQIDSTDFAAIEGRVTLNGFPQTGSQLVARAPNQGGYLATTDEEGRYRIYPAPTGSITVTLQTQGTQREQTVDVTPGETVTADFDVTLADTVVEGIVRMNGQPLAQASVSLFAANGDESQSRATLSTDAEGSFRAQNLPEGDYKCEVVALPRVMSRPEFVLRETREISVKEGNTTRVEFDFAGAAIEGRVSGVRKDEFAHAWLLMGDAEAPEISPGVIAMLDQKTIAGASPSPDGVVQFFGLAPGPYIVAVVALPKDNQNSEIALLQSALAGRYAAAQVDAPAGEVVQVELPLP